MKNPERLLKSREVRLPPLRDNLQWLGPGVYRETHASGRKWQQGIWKGAHTWVCSGTLKNNNICAQFKSKKAHKSTQWKVSLPLLPFSSHAGALTKDNHSFQFPMYSSRYSIAYFLPQMGRPLVATLSDPKVIPSSKHCQVPLETMQKTGQPGDTIWPCKRFHRGTDFLPAIILLCPLADI